MVTFLFKIHMESCRTTAHLTAHVRAHHTCTVPSVTCKQVNKEAHAQLQPQTGPSD